MSRLPPQFRAFNKQVKIAVWASLIANFCLCVLQRNKLTLNSRLNCLIPRPVYAAISSLSLSLLATGIDAIFDIGSNILLFWLHKKADRLDSNAWPVGGARLETIGNIVYGEFISLSQLQQLTSAFQDFCSSSSFFADLYLTSNRRMGSVNLVVIVESAQSLITKKNDDLKQFHLPSILAVAAALGISLKIGLEHLDVTIAVSCETCPVHLLFLASKEVQSGPRAMGGSSK
jgi:hypothetical protein